MNPFKPWPIMEPAQPYPSRWLEVSRLAAKDAQNVQAIHSQWIARRLRSSEALESVEIALLSS